jgi:hypothetical protein
MSKRTPAQQQPSLIETDPKDEIIARLQAELQHMQHENEELRQQVQHWRIARTVLPSQATYGEFHEHAIREDGLYIKGLADGHELVIFVDRQTAEDFDWIDLE